MQHLHTKFQKPLVKELHSLDRGVFYYEKNRVSIGQFDTLKEAAMVRDMYIIKNGLWEYKLQVVRSG